MTEYLRDVVFLAGLGMGFYGVWLIHPPAAFVVTGYTLAGCAALGVVRKKA